VATITVKNIPDELYAKLKSEAAKNRRSINNEVIVCIERRLLPERLPARRIIERARRLRAEMADRVFTIEELEQARR
jgi:plasmid stability protein